MLVYEDTEVDAFHGAGVGAGGHDNGPPGGRPYGGYHYARPRG